MFKKYYFASAIVKKGDKEVRTLTIAGWDWFWVSPKDVLKNIQDEIWNYCTEDMDKYEYDGVHVVSFNRV